MDLRCHGRQKGRRQMKIGTSIPNRHHCYGQSTTANKHFTFCQGQKVGCRVVCMCLCVYLHAGELHATPKPGTYFKVSIDQELSEARASQISFSWETVLRKQT